MPSKDNTIEHECRDPTNNIDKTSNPISKKLFDLEDLNVVQLKSLCEKRGLKVDFTKNDLIEMLLSSQKPKIETPKVPIYQEPHTREKQQFDLLCQGYGLEPRHYLASIQIRNNTWALHGFLPNRPKYCLDLRRQGKRTLGARILLDQIDSKTHTYLKRDH